MSKKQQEIKVVEKKRHRGLKIFAIVMAVIIVLPIAFVFIAFYDTTTKKVSNSEVTYQNIVSKAIVKGFDALHDYENPRLELYISPDMFDGIMMSACDSINQKKWIPKMYCYVKDNNYTFVMDAQASFFKTRLLLHAKLGKVEKEDSSLIFKITGLTIGRLPIPTSWIAGIAGNFIKEDTINNAFAKAGFNIKCNLKKLQLTYTREQFRIDVANYLNSKEMGGNSKFLNVLLSTFDNDKVLETDYKNGVTVDFKLRELMMTEGSEYYKKAPLEFTELDEHKNVVTSLLNNGLAEADAGKVFTYLIRGFSKSEQNIQDFIEGMRETDLGTSLSTYVSTISGKSLDEYTGSKYNETQRFNDYCLDTLALSKIMDPSEITTMPDHVTFKLPSDDLNRVLASKLDIIGTTIPITFKDEGKWTFEYITVDNIYTGFKNAAPASETPDYRFNIYMQLNISGMPVTLCISTDNIDFKLSTEGDKLGCIKFNLNSIYFGNINITSLKDDVIGLIPETPGGAFTYNKEEEQFEVNIDAIAKKEELSETVLGFIHAFLDPIPQLNFKKELDESTDTFTLTYPAQ